MSLTAGDLVAHYQIVGLLGAGGMGEVYKARDPRLDRFVALKFPQRAFSERLTREARMIASVSHRSICRLLDLGESNGACYLVLEYVEGETLAARLRHGPVPLAEGIGIALEILGAVAAMHGLGLVHGDLKPGNIMLTSDGPRVLDFGLARLMQKTGPDEVTRDVTSPMGGLSGTPGYMAPEQVNGASATPMSDLFALGAMFFEMFSGQPAFPGTGTGARLAAVLHGSPPSLSGSAEHDAVDHVLRRSMAKTPTARYASASEFADALRNALHAPFDARESHAPRRILVLPFQALRQDPDSEFLAQMLPDAIASELASVRNLQVRSSLIGKRYGPSPSDLKAISAEAAVDLLVSGTLARMGEQVRVSTQLLELPAGTIVAVANFQSRSDDLFALQDQAVSEIMRALEANFGPLSPQAAKDMPRTAAAYDVYLRANQAAQDRRRTREAIRLYEQCLKLDGHYAPAWAHLGRCYRLLAKYSGPPEHMKSARQALERALSLNPDLDIAHSYYAQLQADEGKATEALIRLLRMARETPQSGQVFAGLVYACRLCGLFQESVKFHRKARKLDPTLPTSVTQTYFQMGEYLHCLETYSGDIGYIDALALDSLGLPEEALSRTSDRLANPGLIPLATVYVRSLHALLAGDNAESYREVKAALQSYWLGPEELFYFARHAIRSGDKADGLTLLGDAVRRGYFGVTALVSDPWLNDVRLNVGFAPILEACREGNRRAAQAFQAEGGLALLDR